MAIQQERLDRRVSNLKLAGVLQPGEPSPFKLKSSFRFLRENCPDIEGFLDFLYRPDFLPLVSLTVDLHKDEKRKATDDPYMKHILLATYYVYKGMQKERLTDSQKRVILGGSLLHDYIEIKQKEDVEYNDNDLHKKLSGVGIDQLEANEIFLVARLDTPKPKPDSMPGKERIKIKREDFDRIMNITPSDVFENYGVTFPLIEAPYMDYTDAELLSRYIKEIKIADMAAILKETYEDMLTNSDGNNIESRNDLRPLRERIIVFQERLDMLKNIVGEHPLFFSMKMDLSYMASILAIHDMGLYV
ncbi:hypothetical protein HZA76_00150 [Candidatus Roizmanbacteria bacterium]|nr:hypothetical protein [Candidatus Roizmanbacteria bacterium]